MQVKIYDVRVPDKTTRFFQVPAYDIPVIKLLWRGRLPTDYLGNVPVIEVFDHGVVEPRNLHNELRRMQRDYSTAPDGKAQTAFRCVYATDEAFAAAYQEAMAEAQREAEAQARRREFAQAQDSVAQHAQRLATAAGQKRRGGRPRKTQPAEPAHAGAPAGLFGG